MSQVALTALCFQMPQFVQSEEKDSDIQWLPMIPAGTAEGRDGRKWFNNNPDAVVAAFDSKLPFDVEHSTEIKGPQGEDADAYGWIVALENRNGEIWAGVEWNDNGIYKIKDKRYGFYSPAFSYDDKGNIVAMSSAGLTNKPNFRVPALNRSENKEDTTMPLPKALADALALPENATEQDAVTAIGALKSAEQIALNRAAQPDLTKFVPNDTYEIALNRATAAEASLKEIEDKETEALVDVAIAAGKVAPANKEMYVALCRTEGGREKFEKFAETAPKIVDAKPKKVPTQQQSEELTKDEIALCRQMGVSEESWKANRHHKATY
ncbi:MULTISPECIES: phage protease [Marinomonas]|uniref:Phage protease n=1 Tax=Marinomonas rhodophyticola TaxID=2992803 RepID=A0ABT3KCL8_9GAMM|nr:phage protease [Marinomonas sp. KJ51-3]MCW4628275.1 phage protease [Marinomonas sp. KJ51-3]